MSTSRDDSDPPSSEAAREESARLYRSVVEDLQEMVLRERPDGTIVFANGAYARMIGSPAESLVGRDVYSLAPAPVREPRRAKIAALRPDAPFDVFSDEVTRPDGTYVFEGSYRGVFDEQGRLIEVQTVLRDVTQLRAAMKELREAIAARDTLLAELRHRVRNNMQIIAGLVRLHASAASDADDVRLLRALDVRISSLVAVHEQLYLMSPTEQVELRTYLARLLEGLSALRPADVDVTLELDAEAGLTMSRESIARVGMMIAELCTNAFKHAFVDRKKGVVRVRATSEGARIRLEVADDGRGTSGGPWQPSSLGMEILDALSAQLRGTMSIDCSAGTTVTLSIPR